MKTGAQVWRALAKSCLLCAALGCLHLPGARGEKPDFFETNAVNGSLVRSRPVRSVDVTPAPTDCQLSTWSSWTACDPCQKKRYRHTYLLRPSQFYGELCDFSDKEVEDCVTNRACRSQVRCEGFVCAQTGRCVNRRLLCNGDNDCGDQSDEANCRRIYKKCSQDMEQYWAIGNLASGINLFTNTFEGPVLDHRYYAGACSPHYILNTNFRKPYNVESYTPQTQGKYEFALTEYESYFDFEHNVTEKATSKSSFKFGFKLDGLVEFGVRKESNEGRHYISRTKRFSHTKSKFLHARSVLEVAHYKLKSRQLMLHYEFLQRVKSLPLEYSYGEYRDLLRDFGTHFITEAVLGGIYEYTLIMNKDAMERGDYTLDHVSACAGGGFQIGGNVYKVYLKLGVSEKKCSDILNEIKDRNKRRTMVEDLVVLVRGGTSEYITSLAYKDLPTAELMKEWGDAVQYNPAIIKLKAEPLYELVTATDFAYSSTVKQNMKKALEEFQMEVSSCRCAPCRNNGVPILKESRCECICPAGFQGVACEVTNRKDIPIDGKWSCWSDWSPCSGGRKTRQRQCNNPAPQRGGSPCSGPASETLDC
ncbi:complement component 8, beta polypeptide (mapped) [Rattus norvegicus]|uniref:Complement component C8 beta chain n=2 Tax=Rattus norvegicus TaxID=10116 RepID=CO8B_RAT|nr:complement component C8 beta chain precursor [Rattus norvegicus]P55314.2 RecName: Full=Complement component C8 beta chain; AltName: Full=Complement component 8 subunit beta; Flags: Precursor [Rattus norvegicus]EDL97879.1 complement component 8, beta polypeptide (mapped) [Rattus norvegicus]|eukprot:NP_001178688.1 complement component C8 beta chain precursor [Rattus norvegicus]